MTPLPHRYEIAFGGGREGYGAATAIGLPDLPMAPPPEFAGPGDAWSPEHLLLAAVASCFAFTLRAVMRGAAVPFERISVHARGTVAKQAGATRFTEIVITPRITVDATIDPDRLLRLVDEAEDHCLIAASLATPVRVEPEFVETRAASAA